MNRVAGVVRLEDIVVAVAIEIHKAQAVVAALGIQHGAAFGQRVARGFPFLFLVIEFVDVAVEEQFARAVVVEVTEPDSAVFTVFRQLQHAGQRTHQLRVHLPFFSAPRPCAEGDRSLKKRGHAFAAHDSKAQAHVELPRFVDIGQCGRMRRLRFVPAILFRTPDARDILVSDAREHIHEAVAVHVEQAYALVAAVLRISHRPAEQCVPFDALHRFAEGEELHALAVLFLRVVDELHPLLRRTPAVRMEDGRHHALPADDPVQPGFPVGERLGVLRALRVERLPVARRDAREFPAQLPDDVRIRVVLDEARVVAQ